MYLLKTSDQSTGCGRPDFTHEAVKRHILKNFVAGIVATAVLLGTSVAVNAETKGLEK